MSGPETAHPPAETRTGSRWLALAERIGARVSWVMSGVLLTAIYFLLLPPFRLLAGRWESGWVPSQAVDLDTQF